MSVEIKQVLDDLTSGIEEFKAAQAKQVKRLKDDVDAIDARVQKLAAVGPIRHASNGAGWLDLKALGSSPDPAGGYLVNDEQSSIFLDALRPESVLIRAGARVFMTEAAAVNFPGLSSDASAVWRGEGDTLTTGDPVFRRVRATIRKLQAFSVIPNEAMSDSRPEIARLVEASMSAQLALGLDRAAFDPNHQTTNAGAAPVPFASVSGIQDVDTLGNDGGVPANLDWLTAAIGKLLTANGRLDRAALFLSPRTYGDLLKIDEASGSVKPLLWSDRALDGGPLMRILGVPTFVSSVLPDDLTTGNSTDTSSGWLIDMAAVFVVVRTGTRVEIDRSRYFDTDSTALRATMRGDVVLAYPELAVEIPGFRTA